MKLYGVSESQKIVDRFSKELGNCKPGSRAAMDGLQIYMEFVSAAERWLDERAEEKISNGFKLFGWEDLEGERDG